MVYIVLADIHSNLEALDAVTTSFPTVEKKIMCVGDVVGYGADPERCVEYARSRFSLCVLGNHDAAIADRSITRYFNDEAREAVYWTRENLSAASSEYLGGLVLVRSEERFTMAHGTLHSPEKFFYMEDYPDADLSFRKLKTDVCFVGHSHVPGVFSIKNGKITYSAPEKLKLEAGTRYIINVGSVGQPRDGDNRACYAIYHPEERKVEFRRVAYDIAFAQRKIIAAGLPPRLAERLAEGR